MTQVLRDVPPGRGLRDVRWGLRDVSVPSPCARRDFRGQCGWHAQNEVMGVVHATGCEYSGLTVAQRALAKRKASDTPLKNDCCWINSP